MPNLTCTTCGGKLILTIGSDQAVCDHCGQTAAVDPVDVKRYQDLYQTAQTLMRTGTRAGYADALTRLQSIDFIPQAKEAAAQCEKELALLREAKPTRNRHNKNADSNNTALGVVIVVAIVVLLLLLLAVVGFAVYHLIKGDLSRTQMIVLGAAAAVIVLLGIIGKIKS